MQTFEFFRGKGSSAFAWSLVYMISIGIQPFLKPADLQLLYFWQKELFAGIHTYQKRCFHEYIQHCLINMQYIFWSARNTTLEAIYIQKGQFTVRNRSLESILLPKIHQEGPFYSHKCIYDYLLGQNYIYTLFPIYTSTSYFT